MDSARYCNHLSYTIVLVLLILFAVASPGSADPGPGAVWEVQIGGRATNGGGFDPMLKGATGIDRSQQTQAVAAWSKTDGGSLASSTTFTSTSAIFDNTILGNMMQLVSIGSGSCTTGFYTVVGFNSPTSVTLDRAPCSVGGSRITFNTGGALNDVQSACNAAVVDNVIYVKAATYNVTTGIICAVSGNFTGAMLIGYTSNRTPINDDTPPVLKATASLGSGVDAAVLTWSGSASYINNLIIDANGQTTTYALNLNGLYQRARRITAQNSVGQPRGNIYLSSEYVSLEYARATNCDVYCWGSINFSGHAGVCKDCVADGNASAGFYFGGPNNTCLRCFSIGNNLASCTECDGFYNNAVVTTIIDSVCYQPGRHCLETTPGAVPTHISGSILADAGKNTIGYLMNADISEPLGGIVEHHNGFYVGSAAAAINANMPATSNTDVTLTGQPFSSPQTNDYSLNNTTGAGAALRSAGSPGALMIGGVTWGTGYADIGPLRHQDR